MTNTGGSWGFSQRPCLSIEGGKRSRRTTGINFGSSDSCAHMCVHIYTYMYTCTRKHAHAQHSEYTHTHTHTQAMAHAYVRGPCHVNPGIKLWSLLLEGLSLPAEPSCQLPSFNLFVFEIRFPVAQADSGPAGQPRMTLCHVTKLFPGRGIHSLQLGTPTC